MTSRHRLVQAIWLSAITLGASQTIAFGQSLPSEQIREAAGRAVAAIQASQAGWYEKQACYSCHHQFQPAIAFKAAREHGVPVNETIAALNASRAFTFTDIDTAIQFADVIQPTFQVGYRLMAGAAAGIAPNLTTAIEARFLIARQRPGGDWSGLNSRPPSESSDFANRPCLRLARDPRRARHGRPDVSAARPAVDRRRSVRA
jgi:hypothetical protein